LGVFGKVCADLAQRAGQVQVIRVEVGQHLTAGQLEPLVDGVRLAAVGFADPGQLVLILMQDIQGAVGRSAVHNNVFQVRVVLPQDGLDRLFDEVRPG
jgi:hypothetical protein